MKGIFYAGSRTGCQVENNKQSLNGETSEWEDVTSGVPQGSVLGPLAFVIFINDVDVLALLIAILNKFADDTKPGNKVCNQQDIDALQKCLNDLVEWS